MQTRSAVPLLRIALREHPHDATVRAQVALIRSLVDELERWPDAGAQGLRSQIDEETEKLRRILSTRAGERAR
jgi:hypothetical protein